MVDPCVILVIDTILLDMHLNLSQFLPQDRVCEFAKLTPVQLLQETEKAVGDPQLPVQHQRLVEKRRELKDLEVVC